eukprot:symbB.v1.2.006272.t1/scaffold363.1/size219273/5
MHDQCIAHDVEAALRQATRSATGAVEEQLATAQRQHADEIRVRLLALERSMGSLQHRLSHAESQGQSSCYTIGIDRWQDVAQILRVEIDDARQRVDALERWLREALAPEVVRVQLDLASERRCREQLERKAAQSIRI